MARIAAIRDLSQEVGTRAAQVTTATPTRRAMYLTRLTINAWRTILVTHPVPEKLAEGSFTRRTSAIDA